jgi:N-carbamoyl-L-amino-acid hydrolase
MIALFRVGSVSSPTLQSQSLPLVNGDRVIAHLKAMGEIGKDPAGGISRVAYSEADRQGRKYVIGLMRAAGLTTSIDSAGLLLDRGRSGSTSR